MQLDFGSAFAFFLPYFQTNCKMGGIVGYVSACMYTYRGLIICKRKWKRHKERNISSHEISFVEEVLVGNRTNTFLSTVSPFPLV